MLVRMLISWIIGVDFVSNWLSESLTSFKQPFQDLVYAFLYYNQGNMRKDNERLALYVGAWVGTSVFLLRVQQSHRNGLTFVGKPPLQCLASHFCMSPFAKGALKCILNIITIWVSYQYKQFVGTPSEDIWMYGWLAIGLISSIYAFGFDIFYDWNLFSICRIPACNGNPHNPSLRKDRIFRSKAFYFTSVVLNFFLRLAWMLTLSTDFVTAFFGSNKYVVIMSLSFAEFFRRGLWNIFMIEKEHMNNVLKFEAIVSYEPIEKRIKKRF